MMYWAKIREKYLNRESLVAVDFTGLPNFLTLLRCGLKVIKVDETFVVGAESKREYGTINKALVVIAIEVLPKETGRVR